jgi:hypothetical protein
MNPRIQGEGKMKKRMNAMRSEMLAMMLIPLLFVGALAGLSKLDSARLNSVAMAAYGTAHTPAQNTR